MEEKPILIELPNNIECTIESTDVALKNQMRPLRINLLCSIAV